MVEYLAHLVIMLSVYVMLVYALNLVAGEGGLLVFCIGGMWGIGAYAASLAMIGSGPAPFLSSLRLTGSFGLEIAIPLAALAGAVAGVAAAAASLRFRSDAFILATLAVQTLFISLLEGARSVTHGTAGLYALARPTFAGATFPTTLSLSLFAGVVASISVAGLVILRSTKLGLALRALRDHERAATSLGVSPTRTFTAAFAIAGGVAGIAGALYVGRVSYIAPSSFAISESILVVSALLLGGRGTAAGPLAGAAVLILLPEALRFLGMGGDDSAAWRSIMLGVLIVLLAMLRPQGLFGRAPS